MRKIIISIILVVNISIAKAQNKIEINILKGEKWYGLAVNEGDKMPFAKGYSINLHGNTEGNQAIPLLLSTKGRYIWCNTPYAFTIKENRILISKYSGKINIEKPGTNLKQAFLAAAKRCFPASGILPDTLLFARPQYNTWIELIYNQNQKDILKYAHDIIDNGFPPGVIMIDDNWAPYYGRFEFRKDRFPNAEMMISELHNLGFKVMLWVSPFIRPDCEESRFLSGNKLVLMNNGGDRKMRWLDAKSPAIVKWWNGFSMVMDFSNPQSVDWFQQQLDNMIKNYGIDGFKFDGGDPEYYTGNIVSYKNIIPNEHTELWGLFGVKYPLNEYRAMWKKAGQPLVERLRDKLHTWEDLSILIPDICTAGLLGYSFVCPDMIGGGDYRSFIAGGKLDQDLIVRSAQCHVLMPMMQFSVAPWRVLDRAHLEAVKKAVKLRQLFVPEILKLALLSSQTGEPIVTNLEYHFPGQGFENCKDQFMLGETILVAPMVKKGTSREVVFPKGKWKNNKGEIFKGGATIRFEVPIDELLWFSKINLSS